MDQALYLFSIVETKPIIKDSLGVHVVAVGSTLAGRFRRVNLYHLLRGAYDYAGGS